MRLYDYTINVKSVLFGPENHMIISAINKKEAMNFCKDFNGLKVLERCKGKSWRRQFDNIDYLMNRQKELLAIELKTKRCFIEN